MAEPLKNSYGPDIPKRIAAMIEAVHPSFPSSEFVANSLDGYDDLELTPRARQISTALAQHLPPDPAEAIGILVESLGPKIERLEGMEPFIYLPHVLFVAEYGLDCPEESFQAQYELTQRFTAEFSIRAFIERHPELSMARLGQWATDPSVHVRRLVSEGTRPRLPWAARLRRFQKDPTPVITLLEILKDDPEEYVRRSVANNLNDIAKDHPDLVVQVCREWSTAATPQRQRLIRHGLRTLIKQGHPGALALLGYAPGSPVTVTGLSVTPARARIGDKIRIEAGIHNGTNTPQPVLADLRVHFVKANGSSSPKVFKGTTFELTPAEDGTVSKSVSLAQHSTRTHHPGQHLVELLLNGEVRAEAWFTLE